jgi:phosphoglycolate phosphatase
MGLYEKTCAMNLFFDLDGTLIDARKRVYEVFNFLTQQTQLNFDEYWNLKRDKYNHQYILKNLLAYEDDKITQFTGKFLANIEKKQYLDIDQPISGAEDLLQYLKKKNHSLYVVTARQKKQSALYQLEKFKWLPYFNEVLVTEQKTSKVDLILPYLKSSYGAVMIGDTGKDVETGKQLNIETVAVLSGFMSEKSLLNYQPTHLINDVTELTQIYTF